MCGGGGNRLMVDGWWLVESREQYSVIGNQLLESEVM